MDYVTFLLDLAGRGDNRAIRETVRYRRDKATRPRNSFEWKVTCDAKGEVIVVAISDGRPRAIATARWHGEVAEKRQKDPKVPTEYQWKLVEEAVRAELAERAAMTDRSCEPPLSPRDVDEDMDEIEEELSGTSRKKRKPEPRVSSRATAPDVASDAEREAADARRVEGERARAVDRDERYRARMERRRTIIAACAVAAVVVIGVTAFMLLRSSTGPSATATPPRSAPPVAVPIERPRVPEPVPAVVEPVEVRIAKAATFTEAVALAKPAMTDTTEELGGGTKLFATYAAAKLRWDDVDVPAETTVAHVLKDPDVERGKRMCVDGVIDTIERRDLERRKVYVGSLRLADGDAVTFVAVGTTGELVKRNPARFCGAVIGKAGSAASMVGMFDLPENRTPIVEQ